MLSYEISKSAKNTFFIEQLQWLLLSLTRVFKGVRDKNQCDCLQCIPDLAEKGICCRKNPEAVTVDALLKCAYSFIKKGSSIAKLLRTPI